MAVVRRWKTFAPSYQLIGVIVSFMSVIHFPHFQFKWLESGKKIQTFWLWVLYVYSCQWKIITKCLDAPNSLILNIIQPTKRFITFSKWMTEWVIFLYYYHTIYFKCSKYILIYFILVLVVCAPLVCFKTNGTEFKFNSKLFNWSN